MFSKACEYGIKAVVYIAKKSLDNKRVKLNEVAKNTGSPVAYTAKILGLLTKENIIHSVKGPYGGFEIDINQMKNISISQIVYAIDGDAIYNGCALGLSSCNAAEPCPMHEHFVKIRSELKQMLQNTSIYELANKLKSGKSILVR